MCRSLPILKHNCAFRIFRAMHRSPEILLQSHTFDLSLILSQLCMQWDSCKLSQPQLALRNKLESSCTVHPMDQDQVITRHRDRQTDTLVRALCLMVWCKLEKVLGTAFSL